MSDANGYRDFVAVKMGFQEATDCYGVHTEDKIEGNWERDIFQYFCFHSFSFVKEHVIAKYSKVSNPNILARERIGDIKYI